MEVDLPPSLFEEQVARLAASGRVVSLTDALGVVGGGGPSDAVVVTFDDGTADFVDAALPVLAAHGLPVTLYAATAFIETGTAFADGAAPVSWAGLRDAVSTGLVSVGSHTHRHRLLDRLGAADVDDELDRSIELIADRLGAAPADFAYPKAVAPSPVADAAVRRRFRSAALAGTRPNRPGSTDVHRLARSPIQRSDGLKWFERKVAGGMGLEDTLRRQLNRRRYAGHTA
jgi:peptidoglycan/xylan/chitin deacetylase (PgdA/CDA1 family)